MAALKENMLRDVPIAVGHNGVGPRPRQVHFHLKAKLQGAIKAKHVQKFWKCGPRVTCEMWHKKTKKNVFTLCFERIHYFLVSPSIEGFFPTIEGCHWKTIWSNPLRWLPCLWRLPPERTNLKKSFTLSSLPLKAATKRPALSESSWLYNIISLINCILQN